MRVNAPEGKLAISMQIDVTAPPSQRFPYALVEELSEEYGGLAILSNRMWHAEGTEVELSRMRENVSLAFLD